MAATFEVAKGAVNGTNRNFSVSGDYRLGSLRVWRNGALLEASMVDGWEETGSRTFRMKEAPEAGDVIAAYYDTVL